MTTFKSAKGKRRLSAIRSAKRLAVGIALASTLGSTAIAQDGLPVFPSNASNSAPSDRAEIPYPFAAQPAGTVAESADKRIISILGLKAKTGAAYTAARPTIGQLPPVVPASAVSDTVAEEPPTTPVVENAVQLPPATASTPFDAVDTAEGTDFDSESLLDIDIPVPGEVAATTNALPAIPDSAIPPAPMPTSQPTAQVVMAPRAVPADAQPTAMVEAPSPSDLPPVVSMQEATTSVDLKMTVAANETPQPEVVKRNKKMRLNIAPPAVSPPAVENNESTEGTEFSLADNSDSSPAVKFSVSDDQITEATPKTKPSVSKKISSGAATLAKLVRGSSKTENDEPAEFSLSDGPSSVEDSKLATNKPMAISSRKRETQGLEIRVEGEPAVVIPGASNRLANRAPAPTFDPSLPNISTQDSTRKKVKASLVSSSNSVVKQTPTELEMKAETAAQETASSILPVSPEQMTTGEPISVEKQGLVSLRVGAPILQCSAEHSTVCRVFKTGETTLSVVGIANGKTRVAIVTAPEGGKQQVEIREVRVGTEESKQVSLKQIAKEVAKTVTKLYPDCDVDFIAEGDRLVVEGFAGSEREARKVLSFVRKTTLSPVVDKLQVRKD